jgi:phosphohistidine phosphatase
MRSADDLPSTGDRTAARHLYLLRHGPAEDSFALSDEERALTLRGEQLMRAAAVALAQRVAQPRVILSSPYLRARQTAQILSSVLKPVAGVRIEPRLASGALPETILELARAALSMGDTMMVGHNPEMAGAVRRLARGDGRADMPLRPGMLAWFACATDDFEAAQLKALWAAEDLATELGPQA